MLISRARYERDMAGMQAEVTRLRRERDVALSERDGFKAAAKTAAEQFTRADEERQLLADAEQRREALAVVCGEVLVEGGRTGTSSPRPGCDNCRLLDQRLAALQASHEADTRELRDLRQGVVS
ncbi:hypothetical protein [Streptomyces sp. NPDC057257]|uniref:hypothetical protein n=1 Tax=Streptomyces sp. NPDC057257 TaxID=3346071 RepID=UPI00362A7931